MPTSYLFPVQIYCKIHDILHSINLIFKTKNRLNEQGNPIFCTTCTPCHHLFLCLYTDPYFKTARAETKITPRFIVRKSLVFI